MADQPTAPNGRPLDHTARVGHSTAAHRAHGWCAACPGIEPDTELVAWRARDNALHAAADPAQAHDPDSCPDPRAEEVTHGR
ncbi:hypothetical protein [Streptomyces sp. SM8]|uniref:hypothetical protein n=1 Tax=Streptomyces sp. SM8 TaxID=1195457 RepID=UPI00028310EE|nr:hypothetical protein [Streptomyces sp. SM8]PKA32844.1 hypothetical protein SM8_032265 [Streptomyces sp. SM8]